MKSFKSKLISMFMVFAMILSLIGINVKTVLAAKTENTINVKIRVEASDHTIMPETQLTISNFDMTDYGIAKQLNKVNAMNALVMALNNNNISCKDKNKFDAQASNYGGYYIKTINGITAFGNGGWMYCINNNSPYNTMEQEEIKDGDSIVVYYVSDYSTVYSFFNQSEVTTTTGSVTLNLKGIYYDSKTYAPSNNPISGVQILVNDKELSVDGKKVVTDNDGNCSLKFDNNGTYNVSAEKSGITRPYCKVIVGSPEQPKDYTKSINNLIDGISKNINVDGLAVLDMYKAGKQIPTTYLQTAENNIKQKADSFSAVDWESMTLSVLAAGGDPTNIGGCNLVEKVYNNSNINNISSYVFGLLALNAGNFDIPNNSKWNKDNLVKAILDAKINDGGWAYSGSTMDPDMTAMVLSALAPYYSSNNDVRTAIDKAVDKLSNMQTDNGGFKSWGNENSNSVEMVIIGLCDIGIDPTNDKRFVKNGKNLMDALLSFAVSDNSGFGFIDNTAVNGLSTEQGLRALAAYNLFKQGKGSVYRNFKVAVPTNDSIVIINLTTATEFKLGNDANVSINVVNNSKKDQSVILVEALYDNNNQFVNYVSANQTIKAGDSSILTGRMKLPQTGIYKLKAFVWDSMEAMNSLSNTIEIPIK